MFTLGIVYCTIVFAVVAKWVLVNVKSSKNCVALALSKNANRNLNPS